MLSRDDGDADYASAVAAAIDLTKSVLFVTCGAGDDGAFFLSGPEALVDSLSSKVSAPLTWGAEGRTSYTCIRWQPCWKAKEEARRASTRARPRSCLHEMPQPSSW